MPTKKRTSKTKALAIEIVPLSRQEVTAQRALDFKAMLAQMVQETVQQAMSGKGAELQPYFESKEIAYEIKRRQTVLEQNKWSYFYKDWGCMLCGTRKAAHEGHGKCHTCYTRVKQRLAASLRKRKPKDSTQPTFMDTMRIAREALAPAPADEAGKNRSKT